MCYKNNPNRTLKIGLFWHKKTLDENPASNPMGTNGSFSGDKAVGERS
jgi:hypothetical protein